MSNSINQLIEDCNRGFEVLDIELEKQTIGNIPKSDELVRFKNEQSRFTRWSRNAGAFQPGAKSLDQKLRILSRVRLQIVRLLSHIQRLLEDARAITVGDRVPWDQIDSDEDLEPEDEEDSLGNLPETEMEQIMAHIAELIDNLAYLGTALRERVDDNRATDEISPFEPFDIQHVHSKYPGVDKIIAERLGKAISARRQLFQGQESTELGSRHRSEGRIADVPTLETLTSQLAIEDSTSRGSEQMETVYGNPSETSYMASDDLRARRIPPLPEKVRRPFRCPYCNQVVIELSTQAWK
ncbi:hypothetical protein IL306_004738 [Fusarium sp. DS 682]|nr:hypothetical protein IL306_004738 [Fusarium sp. DS 682]